MTESEFRSARLWEDPGASIPERVDALVAAMSPDEKLAQLGSVWQGVADVSGGVAPMQEIFARHRGFAEATGCGIGHLTRPFGTRPVTVREGARQLTEM